MSTPDPPIRDGRIVRSEDPLNLEMPFAALAGFVTPTKSFYVRTHFPVPQIDSAKWQLRVEGEVEKPFAIGYDELRKLESRTIPVTLECAGNSRIFLEPKVKGLQWGLGAVGNAEWTGVPLSLVLERAGVKAGALEVILEGADQGTVNEPKAPSGPIAFARSVPLAKAREDVLLVYQMNGQALPPENGFPVRAIVPGWYAMASVKWLTRVIVTDKQFNGYYQTLDYAFWRREGDEVELKPLAHMHTKAEIARPQPNERVPANSKYVIRGGAWTGTGTIAKVEVSVDGGKNWSAAKFTSAAKANAWRLWELEWQTPAAAGKATLVARATDSMGQSQPLIRDSDFGTYVITHLLPIEVEVSL